MLPPILFTDSRLFTSSPTHRPPFCHANHDKPSAAPGAAAFGSAAFGLATFGSAASGSTASSLFMLVDCFGFIYGWFRVFAAAGCVASGFAMSGSAAAGFEALGLAAAGLAVVRFMQRRVHHYDAFDT